MTGVKTLEIKDIWCSYDNGQGTLRGVDLTVGPGEVVGLLGCPSAGKTTVMRTVMGLVKPYRGSIRVFGLNPFKQSVKVKRLVGYVPEKQTWPTHLRVDEVLSIYRSLFPTWDVDLEQRLRKHFDLDGRRGISSLGDAQGWQVAMLCAAAHRPKLQILDEPAVGLDPATRRELFAVALDLADEQDSAILFSSHHTADVERIAERVVLIDEGRVLLDRRLEALRRTGVALEELFVELTGATP